LEKDGRYDVSGLAEAQFEPGSNEQVLKNRLGIKSPKDMDDAEARALERTMAGLVGQYNEKHRFTVADIRVIHKSWLGEIYEWAGEYRQVNVSKGEFPFAAAARVPALMEQFEREALARYIPCNFKERADVVRALAETHVELVLIHPFREGKRPNGAYSFNLDGTAGRFAATGFRPDCRGTEGTVFCSGTSWAG